MLAWGLGYFGMPHILLRFMGISDAKKLKISRRIGSHLGGHLHDRGRRHRYCGSGHVPCGRDLRPSAASSAAEAVIVQLADLLSHPRRAGRVWPPVLSSPAFWPATMSTADSQLLAASSSVSEDLVKEVFGVKMSSKATMLGSPSDGYRHLYHRRVPGPRPQQLRVHRSCPSRGPASAPPSAPAMLTALFWKRTTKWGVLAGMISGGAMVFIWKYLLKPMGGVWGIYELLPAFIVALAFIVVVSLLTKAPDADTVATFDKVKVECKNTK